MASTITFHVPFILRASRSAYGSFKDEGFYVCDDGVVILYKTEKKLVIVENVRYEKADALPKLTIFLKDVTTVKCSRFQSKGGNHQGGQVCLEGTFDRQVEERITMKMAMATFKVFVQALQETVRA